MTTLAEFLAAGKDPSHIDGMNPAFAQALAAFLAAAPPGAITINSGYRSPERQAQLWADAVARYGSEDAARRWVAPPGRSNHNHGTAADLQYADDAAREWAHANAANYGLNFRMDWEPWHIELAPDGQPVVVPNAPSGPPAGGPQMGPQGMPPAAPPMSFAAGGSPGFNLSAPPQASGPAQSMGLRAQGPGAPDLGSLLAEMQAALSRPKQQSLSALLQG